MANKIDGVFYAAISAFIATVIWAGVIIGTVLGTSLEAGATDKNYAGVHLTIPFSFDAVGAQVVVRGTNAEVRAGIDTRGYWQAGGGVTYGTDFVVSGGAAYSSFQGQVIPYFAGAYGTGNWEVGAVDYGFDAETVYLFTGYRVGRSNRSNSNGSTQAAGGNAGDSGSNNTVGGGTEGGTGGGSTNGGGAPGNGGGSGSGGNGGGNSGGNGNGNGGSGGGGSEATGGNSRSGLGDGTNPGKGKGRENSPNTGTNNPGGKS